MVYFVVLYDGQERECANLDQARFWYRHNRAVQRIIGVLMRPVIVAER